MNRRRIAGIVLLALIVAWNVPLLARAVSAPEPWRDAAHAFDATLSKGVRGEWNIETLENLRMGTHARVRSVDAFAGGFVASDGERSYVIERLDDGTVTKWYVQPPAGMRGPWYAQRLTDGRFLLAMRDEDEILELDRSGRTTRVYGTGVKTHEGEGVMDPFTAERLGGAPDGRLLIGESVQGPRVAEVKPGLGVVWEVPPPVLQAKSARWVGSGAEVLVVDGLDVDGDDSTGTVTIYDRATSRKVWLFDTDDLSGLSDRRFQPTASAWSKAPDGREYVYIGDNYDGNLAEGRVLVVDRATKRIVEVVTVPHTSGTMANPRSVDVAPNGLLYIADDAGPRVTAYGYEWSHDTVAVEEPMGSDQDVDQVHRIRWTADTPYGTKVELFYQLNGVGSPKSAGTTGSFTFPNGTLARSMRYFARLSTPDARVTPRLGSVSVEWLPEGVTPAPETTGGSTNATQTAGSHDSTGSSDATTAPTRMRMQLGRGGSGTGTGTAGTGSGGPGDGLPGATGGSGSGMGLLFKPVKDTEPSATATAVPAPDPGSTRTAVSLLGTLYAIGLIVRPRPWFVPI